jgi:type VII secretion-associated serine protease mycosin
MRSAARWSRLVGASVLLTGIFTVTGPAAAHAVTPCSSSTGPAPGKTVPGVPHALQRFVPDRLAPLSTGHGVTVAVIDSGVDDRHPQLAGKVADGKDFLSGNPDANQDCNGHGTGVASIIAARAAQGTGFRGLAPGATILPVRVTEQQEIDGKARGRHVGPEEFAAAIEWAADHGAAGGVMNLSLSIDGRAAAVERAVAYARSKDIVVVAAAGNKTGDTVGNDKYPAKSPGVLAVAAVNRDGMWSDFSLTGSYVDIAAPGDDVTVAAVGGGQRADRGTSFATPYVAATAALVRARYPTLRADEVVRLIIATADPAPGGKRSDKYGHGIVNPYRALTEDTAQRPARAPEGLAPVAVDPVAQALAERRGQARSRALLVGGVGLGAAVVALVVGLVLPRGVRRRWRPAA